MNSNIRAGVYLDVENLNRNGGYRMRYDVLREFASRDGAEVVRLNAYVGYDEDRVKRDPVYAQGTHNFYNTIRDFGYGV